MYFPDLFTETDPIKLKNFIQKHPLGTLISIHNGQSHADLLPFYLLENDDKLTLVAHFAKANPLAEHIDNQEVLLLFYGEQGYITPNWYPTKQIHHRHVPTWNYEVVQVRGRASVFADVKGLMRAVGVLTNFHEASQPTPWAMKDAPRDYLAEEIQGILGLTIEVSELIGKFKLSQNREQVDFEQVVAGLAESGQVGLSEAVASTRQ